MNEDLLLGPYKLPLKKLSKEEGFGYFGAVSLAKDGKGIQCHVCGAIKNNLSLHLRLHKITVREYREKFGISLNTVLVSESCRNASVERMLALRAKLQKEGSLAAITRLCNERRIESMKKAIKAGTWKKHPMLKPEDLNLRGICPKLFARHMLTMDEPQATPSTWGFIRQIVSLPLFAAHSVAGKKQS
jgi:hypothetical protein